MTIIVKELETPDTEMKKTLANALEAIQEVAQAGPNSFHRVAMDANTIGVMTRIFTGSVIDSAMLVSSSRGEVVDIVLIGEELRTSLDSGDDDRLDRVCAHVIYNFQKYLGRWSSLVLLVASLNQPQDWRSAFLSRGTSSQLDATSSRFASALLDSTRQTLAARTLIGLIGLDLTFQLAFWIQMIRFVDAAIQQVDTALRCALIDVGCFGNLGRIQLQLPQPNYQQPLCGFQFTALEDCIGPVIEGSKSLTQTRGAVQAVVTLQAFVATLPLLNVVASTAGTDNFIWPTQLPQVIGGLVIILQMRYQMFHLVDLRIQFFSDNQIIQVLPLSGYLTFCYR